MITIGMCISKISHARTHAHWCKLYIAPDHLCASYSAEEQAIAHHSTVHTVHIIDLSAIDRGCAMAARQQHAAVLAIGTANPAKCVVAQEEFVDWYFRVTQSDHLPDLKAKMKRMCEIS